MNLTAPSNFPKASMTQASREAWYWDLFAWSLFGVAAFLFLTNGIPLAQLGVVEIDFSKKVCLRLAKVALLSFFIPFLLLPLIRPAHFERLSLIRFFKKIESIPIWKTTSALFILYVALHSLVGFMRHWAIETRAFDLGIFTQGVWTTLQGHFLYSSIKGGVCLLGDHVSPILAALAPFYALWPDPKNLLLIQAIAAGSLLFFVSSFAQEKTRQPSLALLFSLAYFFYYPTRSALHDDFHPEVLGEPFLFLAFLSLERKRLVLFWLSLLAAISTKENMLGASFILGFYALIWKRRGRLGLFLMIASVALLLFDILWVVPHFGRGAYLYRGSYDGLLANPFALIVQRLFSAESLKYIVRIYSPFLFLPFLHLPTLLLTFPVLVQNLLSENPLMRSFGYHYTIGMTPFLFISGICGFCVLLQKIPWLAKHPTWFASVMLFGSLLRSGPAEYYFFSDSLSHKTPHRDWIRAKLKDIPQAGSVLTHNNLIPQIINRIEIYQWSYSDTPSKAEEAKGYDADYVILEREFWEPETRPIEQSVKELKALGYRIASEAEGFYILKK